MSWRDSSSEPTGAGSPDIVYGTSSDEEDSPRPCNSGNSKAPVAPPRSKTAQLPSIYSSQNTSQPYSVTSTPLMTSRKHFRPPSFEDGDVTIIESDGSSNLNLTLDELSADDNEPVKPPKGTGRRLGQIIESESDSEDSGEATKLVEASASSSTDSGTETSEHEGSRKQTGVSDVDESIHDLSVRVNQLEIEKDAAYINSAAKKQFSFKPPKPAGTTADSDQENIAPNKFIQSAASESDDEIEVLGAVGPPRKDREATIDLDHDDFKSPRRIAPPVPKPRSMKFLEELPAASLAGDPSKVKMDFPFQLPELGPSLQAVNLNSAEHKNYASKAIEKLLQTISTIPQDSELAENPPGLRTPLYDHQKYGLQWLWWREHNFPGGGILADEMGLGKTVMIIALILKSKAEGAPEYKKSREDKWLSAETKELIPSRSTLIIVPPGVLGQWESEIKTKSKHVSVKLYHGPKRAQQPAAALSRHDIVLSTYQTVQSDIPKESDRYMSTSPLLRINWERVVLDEGHYIRNSATHAAQAACRLNANHRWVVTGTPVHNKPSDMHSLAKFLRLKPFDDPKMWDFWIGLKAMSRTAGSSSRLHTIGKSLILRRTKAEVSDVGGDVPSIPPKTVTDIPVVLSEAERKVYDHLSEFAESQFKKFLKEQSTKELQKAADNYVAGGRGKKAPTGDVNYTHVFTLILRLRQCAVAPFLIHSMIEDDEDEDLDDTLPEEDEIISKKNPVFAEDFESSKMRQLYHDINQLKRTADEKGENMEKVVIVSQWTTLLDIIERHLKRRGYSTCTISGKINVGDRIEIMNAFNTKPKRPQIMLLSLAAGGCGLNLIGANHLFLMDIHWNPQLELQAQDRIHRFGQKKDVTIHRYVSEETVESRVVSLQIEKLEMATGLLSNSKKNAGGGLTIKEMRQLFDI